MELPELVIEVIGVSASGVLAPGPLFFANLLYGSRQGAKAGLKMAYGHSVVELPLVVILAAGIFSFSAILNAYFETISILGGVATLAFAGFQLLSLKKTKAYQDNTRLTSHRPFVAGILLSALNPFFLIWWVTVGLKLLTDSSSFGIVASVVIVFGFHIWMDYAWITGTAYLASKGNAMLKSRYYIVLNLALVAVLVYFGLNFLIAPLS